jgi:hypothetical protein
LRCHRPGDAGPITGAIPCLNNGRRTSLSC